MGLNDALPASRLAGHSRVPNTAPFGDASRRAPDPRANTGAIVVGVCAFSGNCRGLKLIPSKRRHLVPPMLRDG